MERKNGGYKIPDAGKSKYAGKGAYLSNAVKFKAEEDVCFEYDPGLAFIKDVKV